MSGISMFTACEIFTNPDDLEFIIGGHSGKYGFAITRGPGHHFKILIDSTNFANKPETAILAIEEILKGIVTEVGKEIVPEDPSKVLNQVDRSYPCRTSGKQYGQHLQNVRVVSTKIKSRVDGNIARLSHFYGITNIAVTKKMTVRTANIATVVRNSLIASGRFPSSKRRTG